MHAMTGQQGDGGAVAAAPLIRVLVLLALLSGSTRTIFNHMIFKYF
jgi:hypothetical protein